MTMKQLTLLCSVFLISMLITACGGRSNGEYADGMSGATKSSMTSKIAFQNSEWWPNRLDLTILRQNSEMSDPMGEEFDYVKAFNAIDYFALKEDIRKVLTESQQWWPADYGHYGGLFIRMAWHSAGTYRSGDGRGGSRSGQQRFAPINSWPDNANLDKARRLLWPIKQKYGKSISWADLMILTGNVALEDMGFKTFGFAGGREDVYEPELDVYWGEEKEWMANNRYEKDGKLERPLAAVQMGLIYVNPEGPLGEDGKPIPDPVLAAEGIRETFKRMGMNDEETVALIAGGHTLGKTHGKGPAEAVGNAPEGSDIEAQGLGWESSYRSGKGEDAITSGLEVIWTQTPTRWSHLFFLNLFENEWELTKSPAGAYQWVAKDSKMLVPDAFDPEKKHKPTMLTTDLSMRFDPIYEKISRKFYEDPELFNDAFARAWFKLTHRDMGPKTTYQGPEAPQEDLIWQDPIPEVNHPLVNAREISSLKKQVLNSTLSLSELVETAWAAASTYRHSDRRGGANGSRIRLEPQRSWEVNQPAQLERVLKALEKIQMAFNNTSSRKISMADMIVLAGNAAVEQAAANAGFDVNIAFTPGRNDATQEQTDIESMQLLEPMADGFRNYLRTKYTYSTEELLLDKAQLLRLTAPEMTVLVGGMRALHTNYDNSKHGIFVDTKDRLTNEFFDQLLNMKYEWKPIDDDKEVFQAYIRGTDEKTFTATRADLIFGSNSELRALAEVYAAYDAEEKFVYDFARAWEKVMRLDRFDLVY